MPENNDGEGEQKLHRCFKKDFGPLTAQRVFFKTDTEGDKPRGTGNLFQYFTTRTGNAPFLRRRRLVPCSNL